MNNQFFVKLVTVTSVTFLTSTSFAQNMKHENIVMTMVNGHKIMLNHLEDMVSLAVANGAVDNNELRNQIAKDLIVREAINQDVKKNGLINKREIKAQIKMAQDNVIVDVWLSDYLKKFPITDDDVRLEYSKQLELSREGRNSNEYRFSQILVATEKDAQFILSRLSYGESFELLAKDKSLDRLSANQGGAINWILPGQLIAPLGDVLINLNRGKVNQAPIVSKLGWHIIRLDDIRPYKIPSYDDARSQIYQNLILVKKQEAIAKLLEVTKIGNEK